MKKIKISRRQFFSKMGKGAAVSAGGALAIPFLIKATTSGELPSDLDNEDLIIQMSRDLERALAKPIEKRKWAMVIDVKKCIGCEACSVACIAENNLPPGVTYRRVKEVETGDFPNITRVFMPTNCMQCDIPGCMKEANKVSPGAMSKRPDGIVKIHYKKFKGRKVFEAAQKGCPFSALYFDEGKNHTDGTPAVQGYEQRKTKEYGEVISRAAVKNAGRKCHFCSHRIEAGILPACVTTCTGQAMHFGDLNDPDSIVSILQRRQKSFRLEETSRRPNINYLDGRDDPTKTCGACHS